MPNPPSHAIEMPGPAGACHPKADCAGATKNAITTMFFEAWPTGSRAGFSLQSLLGISGIPAGSLIQDWFGL
jgi:hypothetical protein